MDIKKEDIVTKEYLKEQFNDFGKHTDAKFEILRKDMDLRFETFRKDMSLEFHNFSNLILSEMGKYIGVVMEHMNDRFKVATEAFTGVPELTQNLRDKSINNDYEHSEFRIRLGILEGDKKKK